jgi:hypothetical protein
MSQHASSPAHGLLISFLYVSDFLPSLFDTEFNHNTSVKHLPEWAPGAQFKKKAKEMRKRMIQVVEEPFAVVKEEFVS